MKGVRYSKCSKRLKDKPPNGREASWARERAGVGVDFVLIHGRILDEAAPALACTGLGTEISSRSRPESRIVAAPSKALFEFLLDGLHGGAGRAALRRQWRTVSTGHGFIAIIEDNLCSGAEPRIVITVQRVFADPDLAMGTGAAAARRAAAAW